MDNEEKIQDSTDLIEDAIEEKTNNSLINENKKKKRKIIIISLIIVILLMLIGIAFYISNNPRLIFKLAVNNAFNTLNQTLDSVNDVSIKTDNLSSETYSEKIENFNQLQIDEKNSKVVLDSLKQAILDSTSLEKIAINKMTIKVNDKDIDAKRVTLVIDGNNVNKINNSFIKILKNNDDFLRAYSNITGLTKKEIKQKINDNSNTIYNYIPLTISIYTTGINHEFVKLEISQDINNSTNVINITKTADNNFEYKIVNNFKTITGNIVYQEKNGFNITYSISDKDIIVENGTLSTENIY